MPKIAKCQSCMFFFMAQQFCLSLKFVIWSIGTHYDQQLCIVLHFVIPCAIAHAQRVAMVKCMWHRNKDHRDTLHHVSRSLRILATYQLLWWEWWPVLGHCSESIHDETRLSSRWLTFDTKYSARSSLVFITYFWIWQAHHVSCLLHVCTYTHTYHALLTRQLCYTA